MNLHYAKEKGVISNTKRFQKQACPGKILGAKRFEEEFKKNI
jgi:hypothetical protein